MPFLMTMGDSNIEKNQNQSRLVSSAMKLLGAIQDLAMHIDSLSSRCLEVEDLFSSQLQSKRLALKDCCEELFNLSPTTYGTMAREKLWRLVLYDAVSRARRIQMDRQWTPTQLDQLKTHLQGGIGSLQLFILKLKTLCESPRDPVRVRIDEVDGLIDDMSGASIDILATPGNLERSAITDLVHLCVINIGDLYRYLKEMHSNASNKDLTFHASSYLTGAQRQYSLAYLFRPDSGLAFNQLGNLFCDANGLQSAYYLLHSMQSTNAYECAHANLRQLLDRKMVQFATLPASVEPKPMENLINNIISLMYYFLYENAHSRSSERHCQEALSNLNDILLNGDPEKLDDKFLFHLAAICVMIVWKLQATKSVHTSAAVAFSIAVFCQLVNHLTRILEENAHLLQLQIVSESFQSPPRTPGDDHDHGNAGIVAVAVHGENTELNEVPQDMPLSMNKAMKDEPINFASLKRRKRTRGARTAVNSQSDSEDSDVDTSLYRWSDDEEEEYENGRCSGSDESWSDDEDEDIDLSDENEEEKLALSDVSEGSFEVKDGDGDGNKAFDSLSSNGHSDTSASVSVGSEKKQLELDPPNAASDVIVHAPANLSQPSPSELPELELELESESEIQEKLALDYDDLSNCRSQVEGLLVALSPLMRWIQFTPVIKDALAANAEKTFLEKLCSVLNLLIAENWPETVEGVSLGDMKNDWEVLCQESGSSLDEKSLFKWELDEDRSMLGIPQMQDFVKDLKIRTVSPADALVIRIGRFVAFGSWMVSTESFSVMYSAEDTTFFAPTPQTRKGNQVESKLERLKERLDSRKSEDLDKLSQAYQEKLKSDAVEKEKEAPENPPDKEEGKQKRRHRGRRRRRRRPMTDPSRNIIFILVDLEAILNHLKDIKRIAANKKFIVVVPNMVWKALDLLKDSKNKKSGSRNARTAFRWLEEAFGRKHPGFVLHNEQHKLKITFPYPKDPADVGAKDYFEMMEYCNYIMSTLQKSNQSKSRPTEQIWGDIRDKCRVFFLTGHEDLLDTKVKRSFDPVKIARHVGIFVDFIAPYPGLIWKSTAKSTG